MKIVFNQKGSTLLMVLIMTAVLTILGTALISMTFMNINMKYNNDRVKKAIYYSESGIDQVYAYVGYTIEETLEDARDETDQFKEKLLHHLEESIEPIKVEMEDGTIEYMPPLYPAIVHEDASFLDSSILMGMSPTVFLSELGLKKGADYTKLYIQNGVIETGWPNYTDKILDMEALTEVLDNYYKLKFMYIYNAKYSGDDNRIDDYIENELEDIYYNGEKCNITVTNGIDPFVLPDDTNFTIKGVHSEFNYNDRVTKAVTTNIVVKAPEKLYPFITIEDVILVENNPIWQNALVANDDIIFEGNAFGKEVEIYGDVYAYGAKTIATDKKEGIALENGAQVTVYGDMVTKKNIQTTGVNDNLAIKYGLIYCDSLMTQAGADNSTIEIENGNLFTNDDIELNAVKSDISITNGSYYGFSDGSLASTHDNSSAIIINVPLYKAGDPTDDVNKPATLYIDGVIPTLDPKIVEHNLEYYQVKNTFKNSDSAGVWIPGTAYVNIGEPVEDELLWPYQTGESVSVIGNYFAYTIELDSPSAYAKENVDFMDAIMPDDPSLTIPFAVGWSTLPHQYFNVNEKKAYFLEAYTLYKELFNFGDDIGTNDSLNISNYKYVLGTKVWNDGTVEGDSEAADPETDIKYVVTFHSLKSNIRHDFNYYLNHTTNYSNLDGDGNNQYPGLLSPDYASEPADNYDVLEAHIGYNHEVTGILNDVSATIDKDSISSPGRKATEIIYVSHLDPSLPSYTEPNIRLVGKNASSVSGYTDIEPNSNVPVADKGFFQGIIITQGDVLIDGDVNFTGTIIAGGTITVSGGTGKSEFHNTEPEAVKFMAKIIRDNPSLRAILKKGAQDAQGAPIQFSQKDIVQGSESSNVKNVYKRLIDFEFWRLN